MLAVAVVFALIASTVAFAPVSKFGASSVRAVSQISMTAKEGDTVPNVLFKARVRDESIGGSNPFKWKDVHTTDLFKGKRVVLFALPGGILLTNLDSFT